MTAEPVDGRHERSARSRAAVVDAMLDLLREHEEQPSAQQIADRAGVSLRTVFRHHDDMESLLATAVEHQMNRVGHHFEPVVAMSVDEFVDQRTELFEEIAGVRRAAVRHDRIEVVRAGLEQSHRSLRSQAAAAFGIAGELLDAVDMATSWAAWDALRRDQGLAVQDAKAVVCTVLTRLLDD